MRFIGFVALISGLAALFYGGFHEAHTVEQAADAILLEMAGAMVCVFGGLLFAH
jgi:hypothetical protein